jgi:hypothetical protein
VYIPEQVRLSLMPKGGFRAGVAPLKIGELVDQRSDRLFLLRRPLHNGPCSTSVTAAAKPILLSEIRSRTPPHPRNLPLSIDCHFGPVLCSSPISPNSSQGMLFNHFATILIQHWVETKGVFAWRYRFAFSAAPRLA